MTVVANLSIQKQNFMSMRSKYKSLLCKDKSMSCAVAVLAHAV